MLEASLERQYSASPGEAFFTGGGLHTFGNFDREDDAKLLTVREGFQNSVNLVFIRLMRDVVPHHLYGAPAPWRRVLEDPADPRRDRYLTRFADREGSEFVRRFYRKYQRPAGRGGARAGPARGPPDPAAASPSRCARSTRRRAPRSSATCSPPRLPGRALVRQGGRGALRASRARGDARSSTAATWRGVHPLELWLVGYLRRHPGAGLGQVLRASAPSGRRSTAGSS